MSFKVSKEPAKKYLISQILNSLIQLNHMN